MFVGDELVAGDLIGKIRGLSGLTQAELARRAGMQSSVLSAYEHGRRQPSAAALARIARAAGLKLELTEATGDMALQRQARILDLVLDLAGSLPFKGRGELKYPPLIALRA